MKTTITQFLAAASLALAAAQAHGQIRVVEMITFDGIPSGTDVNNYYASSGVTFTDILGGNVYAVEDPDAGSAPNAVSVWSSGAAGFNCQDGVIQATFSEPVPWASIEVVAELWDAEDLGTTQNRPYLEAFDASGNLINGVFYPQSDVDLLNYDNVIGPSETLLVTSSTANISYVRFSASYDAANDYDYALVVGVFDNLRYPGKIVYIRPVGPIVPIHPLK